VRVAIGQPIIALAGSQYTMSIRRTGWKEIQYWSSVKSEDKPTSDPHLANERVALAEIPFLLPHISAL
jgi:hypothetical protein